MRKVVRTRIFTVVLTSLILLALILLSSFPGSPLNHLTSPVSAIFKPIQSSFRSVTGNISDFWISLTDGMSIRQENEKLAQENAQLKNKVSQLEAAGRNYEELKTALQLKDKFDRYEIAGARILTRELGTWFDVFKIGSGTADGITITESESFAVVDAQSRLIGRVLSSDLTTAKVLPLLHEGFAVSARVNEVNGAIVRLRGDIELKENNLCVADQIPSSSDLRIGDELVTSGLGGLFPEGILIGSIIEFRDDAAGRKIAIVRPSVDFDNMSVVFIMKGLQS
jgi:rod shape-determining protein MreC